MSPLPDNLIAVGSTLLFTADDGRSGRALWKSDGTISGTVLVKDLRADQKNPFQATGSGPLGSVLGNALVFPAVDQDFDLFRGNLWISDGTGAGTRLLKEGLFAGSPWNDLISNGTISPPRDFTRLPVLGGALFFPAREKPSSPSDIGMELWKTNGTPRGTEVIKDFKPSSSIPNFPPLFKGFYPKFPTLFKNKIFFLAAEQSQGRTSALWKTDGTEAGTIRVDSLTFPSDLIASGNTLFFTAIDTTAGRELWKSDGTAAGTFLLKDINPLANGDSNIKYLTNVNGTLFFTADDGIHGRELWISNGTEVGTKLLKDTSPFNLFGPSYLTVVGGNLFFTVAGDLWKSDGTEAGTVIVKPSINAR